MHLSERSVIKHSAAVQISNSINLIQRRAWNILLANAYYDLPDREIFEVDYQEYSQALGISRRRNKKYVEEYLGNLISSRIEWNVLGKVADEDWGSEWGASGLLASAVIKRVKGQKKIFYSYSAELRKRLYNPRLYAKISLSMQNKFSSKHALALYELCVDYFIAKKSHDQSPFISLTDFRKIMGLQAGEYKEFKFLKQWIIKKPLLEINSKSDLVVRIEYQKKKRKVTALKFFITPQKNNPALFMEQPPQQGRDMALYNRLKDYFHLTTIQAQDILARYSKEQIQANLHYVEEKIKAGTIKSIGAYTLTALKENYQNPPDLFAMEQNQKALARKKQENKKREQDRLEEEYEQEKERLFKKLVQKYPRQELIELQNQATKEICQKHGPNFKFATLLSQRRYKDKLLTATGFPCCEEWLKERRQKSVTRMGLQDCSSEEQPFAGAVSSVS